MPIDFPTRKLADPASVAVTSPAADDTVQGRTASGADRNFALGNLAGIAPIAMSANTGLYATGVGTWASYMLTTQGRTFLAAADQAAQRTVLDVPGRSTSETITQAWRWDLGTNGSIQYTTAGTGLVGVLLRSGNPAGGDAAMYRNDIRGGEGMITMLVNATLSASAGSRGTVLTQTSFRPSTAGANNMSLGESATAWSQVFAQNTSISTSDERLKTAIRALKPAEVAAFAAIARLPAIWRWIHRVEGDDTCEPEGWEARKHGGPTVQAAMAIMEANGLDPFAYACFCYDQWEAEGATYDEDGEVLTPAREAGDRYSFRKEELLCLCLSALAAQHDQLAADHAATRVELEQAMELVQELLERVAALESRTA